MRARGRVDRLARMGHRDLHRLAARIVFSARVCWIALIKRFVIARPNSDGSTLARASPVSSARSCASSSDISRNASMRVSSAVSDTSARSVARSPRSRRARNSMSLTMMRRRSNASRFDSSVSRSRLAERSRASATCVWPIRMLTGSVCAAARCAGADGGGDSAGRAWPRPVGIMDGERDGGRGRQPGRQICSIPNAASFGRSSTSIWLYASRTAPSRSRC